MRYSMILVALVILLALPALAEARRIGEAEAVKIAEQFIADNGYTDAPPRIKHPAPESLTFLSEADEVASRCDSLEPKAYGVIHGARIPGGWTVVFLYSRKWRAAYPSIDKDKIGRAVIMDAFGRHLMVEHKDIFLKAVERKLSR